MEKLFDHHKGGIPNVRDENKGGYSHQPPVDPDLDYKREATPVRDTMEIVDTAGPAAPPSTPVIHKSKPVPENWGNGSHDLHKGGTNVIVKKGGGK